MIHEHRLCPKNHDILLITGDGRTLPDDLERFLSWNLSHDVMCIGRSIQLYPGQVTHYSDVDADAGKWVVENLARTYPDKGDPVTHTLGDVEWFDIGWEVEDQPIQSDEVLWHGSTALFSVLVGLSLGYDRIVLAGCPMDSKGHWYFSEDVEPRGLPKWTPESYQVWFEFAKHPKSYNVRSMSGYTKTLLAPATAEWSDGYIDAFHRGWVGENG